MDFLNWGAIIGALGSFVAAATFWINRGKAEARADGAHSIAIAALAKADFAIEKLAEARVEFADQLGKTRASFALDYASNDAINGLREEIRGVNMRLDRIFERLAGGLGASKIS